VDVSVSVARIFRRYSPSDVRRLVVINVNGKSWLTFQHLLVNWFDEYGVYVQGASDHLVFANMEADSMIPQGAQPLGFYVNESAPGSVMNEDCGLSKFRNRGGAEKAAAVQYTAKDFQLEVLGKLAEVQNLAESLDASWDRKLEAVREQRLLKFDTRTLIALGAIALSLSGYVIQDARNTARQDSEIEATKARVVRLEQIAATNTEGRIRTEVELGELRDGQAEIKALIRAHDDASMKVAVRK
jgi:hypothetical protein